MLHLVLVLYILEAIFIQDIFKLTIAPMTTLIIRDGISIKVEEGGTLNADGDNDNKIIFTADNIGWGHIWLDKSPGSV